MIVSTALLWWMVLATVVVVKANDDDDDCGIYLLVQDDQLSLYAGRSYLPNNTVGTEETLLWWIDPNKNEYSPWHDYVWYDVELLVPNTDLHPHYKHVLDLFASGLASMASCSTNPNLSPRGTEIKATEQNPNANPNDLYHFGFQANQNIVQGQELTIACHEFDANHVRTSPPLILSMDVIRRDGMCMDHIAIQSGVQGRRATATRDFAVGQVIATSPVLHFDRSQMEVVFQEVKEQHFIPVVPEHKIEYHNSRVLELSSILNACYGHVDSNLLLLPLASGVHAIQHASTTTTRVNVQLRWKLSSTDDSIRDTVPLMELLEDDYATELLLEYVAKTPIQKGDALFMDYGFDFDTLWKEHQSEYRHEIQLPDSMLPSHWNKTDPRPYGDFIASRLTPGQMAPIRWNDGTAQVVTPWAFRIGLPPRVRHVLLEYCHRMGITDIFRHVTTEGNALQPGTEEYIQVEGDQWYLQRPANNWRSNLQWFSPGGSPAHEHYLQALSVAGFDDVLESIGDYLGMDGLVAFHVTFIAVSFSNKGYLHHDVIDTGAKVYNVIIPLILANETGPELDLQEFDETGERDESLRVGRYRYEYDIASMQGDASVHATSACDYRMTKEMRMAATVYIADVNDENLESVMNHYTQAYPPRDMELLKHWKARHWKRGDPTRKLPKPTRGHILYDLDDLEGWIGESPSEEL